MIPENAILRDAVTVGQTSHQADVVVDAIRCHHRDTAVITVACLVLPQAQTNRDGLVRVSHDVVGKTVARVSADVEILFRPKTRWLGLHRNIFNVFQQGIAAISRTLNPHKSLVRCPHCCRLLRNGDLLSSMRLAAYCTMRH